MIFRQLFDQDTYTYTYILADSASKQAVIIDPVLELVDRDMEIVEQLNLKVKYLVETHVHADHITGAGILRDKLKGQIVAGSSTELECADILLNDGDEIHFGAHTLKAISTPGHTNGCTSWYCEDRLFTGDTLMIRGCGRTDFQQGDADRLYHSVTKKLFTFKDETLIYPAHDYRGRTCSSIGEEKQFNPRLGQGKTLQQFVEIMAKLNLPYPKLIDKAVPGNQRCGV